MLPVCGQGGSREKYKVTMYINLYLTNSCCWLIIDLILKNHQSILRSLLVTPSFNHLVMKLDCRKACNFAEIVVQ
jgi:hypothetical protein